MHSRYHTDSEYVLYVGLDHKGAEFINNKHIHAHIGLLTHKYTRLYN